MASGSNPQSSQVMPRRLKVAVEAKEAEIAELNAEMRRLSALKDAHIATIAEEEKEIKKLKTEIKDRHNRIFQTNLDIDHINETSRALELEIHKKSTWVSDVKELYP